MATIKKNEAAIIFTPEDVRLAIPRMKDDADVPKHVLACVAIGARLMKDAKWRNNVVKEAFVKFDAKLAEGEGK